MNLGCTLESAVALAKDDKWEFLRRRLAPLFSPSKLEKSGVSTNAVVSTLYTFSQSSIYL